MTRTLNNKSAKSFIFCVKICESRTAKIIINNIRQYKMFFYVLITNISSCDSFDSKDLSSRNYTMFFVQLFDSADDFEVPNERSTD